MSDFDALRQHAIFSAKDQNISTWLSALPLVKNQFDLSAHEFRDGLGLRYKKPLSQMSKSCVVVIFGGLVGCHHNEVRDTIGDLAFLVWGM